MKQKDLPLIIIVVIIAATFSFLLSGKLFSAPKTRQLKVEQVDKISPEFPKINNGALDGDLAKYINKDSINPTSIIRIGDGGNTTPISDKSK